MELFQKRWFALLLCALVMCGSFLLNTRVGLGREVGRVNEQLYADKSSAAASVLTTVRSGVSALGAISDQAEIDSAVQSIDEALALLDSGASLATRLAAYCEALDVPITLAKLSGLDASEAEAAVSALNAALSSRADAETLRERYHAAQSAGDALLTALGSAELSESQRERAAQSGEQLQKLRRDIASNSYNEAVQRFLRRNGSGFTRLAASLAGVKYPALFG